MLSLRLDSIAHFARTTPDKLAVHELANEVRLSYGQLNESVDRAASVLSAALGGHPQGKRVAVLSRNSAMMLIVHFACARIGSIFVPLNWRLSASEISFLLEDCEPSLVLFEELFADRIGSFANSGLLLDDSAQGLASRMGSVPKPSLGLGPAVEADAVLSGNKPRARRLRSRAIVEAQHSSESLVAPDRQSRCANDGGALQQAVTHSLMIALAMVMPHELPDSVLE